MRSDGDLHRPISFRSQIGLADLVSALYMAVVRSIIAMLSTSYTCLRAYVPKHTLFGYLYPLPFGLGHIRNLATVTVITGSILHKVYITYLLKGFGSL